MTVKYEPLRAVISGRIQHMAAADVLSFVDPAALVAIRARDPRPELRAYVIAHEGEAEGNLVGYGRAAIQYFGAIVRKIFDRLSAGTPLFRGHNADNSHGGREPIGEVVGKARRMVDGREATVAAVYIKPEHRAERLDVCSIEANIAFIADGEGRARAVDVDEITGIALGDAEVDIPGFPGAKLLAALQAFARDKGETMTKEEIIAAIKEAKLSPGDVFMEAELRDDKTVAGIVESETEKERGYGSRQSKKVEKLEQKLSEQEAAFDQKLKEAQGAAVRAQSRGTLDALMTERKLDDAQKKFVERYFDRFETAATEEEALKADLNKFLDGQLSEFRTLASDVYGVAKTDTKETPGTPAGDGTGQDLGPGNNPLIPV